MKLDLIRQDWKLQQKIISHNDKLANIFHLFYLAVENLETLYCHNGQRQIISESKLSHIETSGRLTSDSNDNLKNGTSKEVLYQKLYKSRLELFKLLESELMIEKYTLAVHNKHNIGYLRFFLFTEFGAKATIRLYSLLVNPYSSGIGPLSFSELIDKWNYFKDMEKPQYMETLQTTL